MLFNSVFSESIADFIQGMASKGVSTNHYMAKTQQANFWYEKIAEKMLFNSN